MDDTVGVPDETGDERAPAPRVAAAAEPLLEPPRLNIANAFTFLRVLLVPLVLWLLTVETVAAAWWALGVFLFAAWTDSVDGWVARRFGRVTRWGQLADPLADKLLVVGTLASLALVDVVPWWAVVVILAREVAVTVARVRVVRARGLVIPASIWGKVKTVTQMVAIAAYLAPPVPRGAADALLWLAVAATVLSGLRYAVDIRRQERAAGPDA